MNVLYLMKIAANSTQALAVIFSIIYFNRFILRKIPYFPLVLGFIVLVELTGFFFGGWAYHSLLYNIASICFFLAMFYMYYDDLTDINRKNIVLVLAGIYILFSLYNSFIQNPISNIMIWNALFGAIALIICIILYFIEFLRSDKILQAKSDLLFWISTAYLLFYVGYTPIRIAKLTLGGDGINLYSLVFLQMLLVMLLNFCLIAGMLWSKKK